MVWEGGAVRLLPIPIANATIDHSAAYIAGWLQALRHDPKCVIMAAGQAQKAADFIQHVTAPVQHDHAPAQP